MSRHHHNLQQVDDDDPIGDDHTNLLNHPPQHQHHRPNLHHVSVAAATSDTHHTHACKCHRRVFILTCVAFLISVACGALIMYVYDSLSASSSSTPNPQSDSVNRCTDLNMQRFWYEEKAFKILYYNHSSLGNVTLFPRVTNITWGSLNDPDMQALVVKQSIWVMDQLMNECRPMRYMLPWQSARYTMLVQLRDHYQRKLDYINDHQSNKEMITGLIPKWYHAFIGLKSKDMVGDELVKSMTAGVLLGDGATGAFTETWYQSVPNTLYGPLQIALGGDIELERHLMLSSDKATDAADWYLTYPGGMNMTHPNGRARIVTIMTKTDADRVLITNLIRASGNLTESVKRQMIDAIKPLPLAQIEAQIVRLARAYSPDRGNLIIEGAMNVLYDNAHAVPTPPVDYIAFPTDTVVITPCMREASNISDLAAMISRLRDRDILRTYQNGFGTIYIDASTKHMYYSNVFTEFDHRQSKPTDVMSILPSRTIITRRVVTERLDWIATNTTHIAAINLQSWTNWGVSPGDGTQVWGRAPYGSFSTPLDANVMVANGNAGRTAAADSDDDDDYNGDISVLSHRCMGGSLYMWEYNYCN